MPFDQAIPAFELAKIEFSYGQEPVLQSLSLSVTAGEFVGLLGPNGSGKSTILRILGGPLQPQRGQAMIYGRPRKTSGRRMLARRVALVPQRLEITFDFRNHHDLLQI